MDQTQALLAAQFRQGLAKRHSRRDTAFEEGIVDRLFGIESPEPGANLRFRAVGSPSQRMQVIRQHFDGIARPGPTFQAANRTGEQPGVVFEGRTLLARKQNQLSHVFPDL